MAPTHPHCLWEDALEVDRWRTAWPEACGWRQWRHQRWERRTMTMRCIDFGVLAWNCLFTALLGEFLGHISPYDVIYCRDPKRTVLGQQHVVWAIQRKNRCNGSTWARDREKNTGQQKIHKSVIFPLFGGGERKPQGKPPLGGSHHWTDSTQKLLGG